VIAEREGEILWEEGCLSVVDYTAEVRRSAQILLKAWTVDQQEIAIEADGLLAVALQHELDHLDGKLIIDRTDPESRREAMAQLRPRLVLSR
jgi:peptide deformylase